MLPTNDPLPSAGATPRPRVLLVEDEPSLSNAIVRLLRFHGYDPHAAATVAEAVREADDWEPHAVLLDLMLPDGNGTTVLKHLREHWVGCRVAVVTASADPGTIDAARAERPDRLFIKPVEFAVLRAWLEEATAGHAA